ncbi:MAG: hypothetical protein K2M36_06000 [Clostridia bacterium]|nr:hypothetical protein [Clostridia bacterium]
MNETLIGFIGAIVGVVVTLILGLLTRKFNYHQLFAQTVSQSRNTWLNEMRDFISTLIAEARILIEEKPTHTKEEHIKNYYKSREQIMLRLNLKEEYHQVLKANIVALDNIINKNNNENLNIILSNIEQLAQTSLKEEWEKVKIEAKGKGEIHL